MCGIAGQVNSQCAAQPAAVLKILQWQVKRGPDDEGLWCSQRGDAVFGHRRLSIIDLSSQGHQPMVSPDGRFTISFNGEIYNYLELQRQLQAKGEEFASNSDTEVLLRLWAVYGPACLTRVQGMYAFAIWDDLARKLYLVRDHFGIKPLYYACTGQTISFASESRALARAINSTEIDPGAMGAFLRLGSVPAPLTIYRGLHAVPAASIVQWDANLLTCSTESYWTFYDAYKRSKSLLSSITNSDVLEWASEALRNSVKRHLVSDVPVGAFLSGGIDSSAVVSLMRQVGHNSISTFSIGFADSALDESRYAALVSNIFETDHLNWSIGPSDFFQLRNEFLGAMDQPTIDGLNIFLVSRLAHLSGIKVVMSGIGGDELFRAYPLTFRTLPKIYNILKNTPSSLRNSIGTLLEQLSNHNCVPPFASKKSQRAVSLLASGRSIGSLYGWGRELFTADEIGRLFNNPAFAGEAAAVDVFKMLAPAVPENEDIIVQIAALETSRYLGSQLLPDSDIFSMAHSIELRVPLVDCALLESIAGVDQSFFEPKSGISKPLLVHAARNLPLEVTTRKKQGFTLPYENWLRSCSSFPLSDLLNKEYAISIIDGFNQRRISWAKRWAIEVISQY